MQQTQLTIIYDDGCGFCHACVRFIKRHAVYSACQFIPRTLYTSNTDFTKSIAVGPFPDSIVVIDEQLHFYYGQAVFRVIREMRFPWNLLILFSALPVKWTDGLYQGIARNRGLFYRRHTVCSISEYSKKESEIKVQVRPFHTS